MEYWCSMKNIIISSQTDGWFMAKERVLIYKHVLQVYHITCANYKCQYSKD